MKKTIPVYLLVFLFSIVVNAQNGIWHVLKTKNEMANCSECGLAAVKGKLYLIGGDGGSKNVALFDPTALTWTRKKAAPLIMHHFQAVPLGNKIYVLDAFSEGGFPNQEPMAYVYSYNVQNDSWQKEGEIPTYRRRAAAGAVAYKGRLYLVNGIQHGHSSGTTNMFDEFNPQTQTWTPLPDAPHIRDHCFATVVKDKLYVVGGRNTSYRDPENKIPFFAKTVLEVDCFDFKTGKWTTLSAKLPLGSGGGALVNLNNILYYMGGERATTTEPNAPRKNTYYLDPQRGNNWTETDSLRNARNGMAAAVINNKIYAAGGSGGGFGGPPPNGMPPGNPPNDFQPNGMDTIKGNRPAPPNGTKRPGSENSKVILEVYTPK